MSPDRFIQRTVGMAVNGHPIPVERYTYEGVFHVWDVYRLPNGFTYATDAREVETPGPQHMAIIRHFGLINSEVEHCCDTPACVNPEHLRIRTEGDDALSREASHFTPDGEGR